MGQKQQILVDTDVLIKVYRGSSTHKSIIDAEKGNLAVSVVTYLELLYGVKTRSRIIDLHKQMRAYRLIHLSETISLKAFDCVNSYGASNSIMPADVLIAATALTHCLLLFTDNKQDYSFITELDFYN